LAAEARVGGMLSGKAGVIMLHVGDGKNGIDMLFAIEEESEIPITQSGRGGCRFTCARRWP